MQPNRFQTLYETLLNCHIVNRQNPNFDAFLEIHPENRRKDVSQLQTWERLNAVL